MSPPDPSLPRVLHLRSSCGFYGAEGVIHNLARHYRGEAITVCLADARDPHTELCDRLAAEGFPVASLPSRGAIDPILPFRLAALIKRMRPDVIHTHEYKSDVLTLATPGRRIPRVATMHGVVRTSGALRRYERMDARALRRFDAVAVVSEGTAACAREYGVSGERIHTVPNGVDTDLFRPGGDARAARAALGIPAGGPLIGMVGRLSEEKGPGNLLDGFAGSGNPEARLAFIGAGPLEADLRARARDRGIAERVHFPGRRDDMPAAYAALDILALPSLSEGLPLTILEASACEIPVVATDVGDVARALPNGLAAVIVPPGDPRALADGLGRLLADPEAARRLAAAARRRVEGEYSARSMAGRYEEIYRSVAHRVAGAERRTLEVGR